MKAGTYGGQSVTTNLTQATALDVKAEDGTTLTGSLSTSGDWLTVENVHAAGGGFSDVGGGHPFNVTWKNIDMTGGIVFIDGGTNFTWQGGSLHDNSVNNEGHLVLQGIPPDCAQGASQCSNDLSNVVIDGIRFYNLTRNATCIQSSCHNEVIRIDNGAHDITIKNNTFGSGNDPNSALIFTGDKGYGANEYNITLEQNFFGSSGSAYYAFDASQCIGLKLNYNTFAGSHPHFACTDATSVKVVGNTGTHPAGCATGSATITWDHNVWSDAACGGTDTGNATLAFAADGFHITSASGAIKNGSSTYCPATDIDGDTRPSAGSACDAGADQYSSSTTTTPPPTGDTTAPTVSLTAPTGGASVSGSVSLTATASDNVGVVGVQFKVDGTAVGSEDTSSPYSVTWSSAAVANGSHSITATARDAAGNTKTSTAVSVTVSNAAAPSGTVLLGNQTVETNADSDPPGTAEAFRYTAVASGSAGQLVLYLAPDNAATSVKLGLYSDNAGHPGSLLASGTVTSPSPGTWNTVNFTTPPSVTAGSNYWVGLLGTGGTVSFRNQATGSCSESASTTNLTSLPATWTTGPVWSNCQLSAYVLATSTSTPPPADSTAPTTSLTNPTSGASVSGTTTVTASASDNVAVTKVDFYLDGALIASDTTAPYSFGWTTTASSNGSHSLQSKAYDAASNTGSSSVVTVTVNNGDSTPPTAPTGLTASATGPTSVDLSWSASSDNVGVTKYYVLRNGAVIASVTAPATSYSDNTAVAATSYSYQVTAADAASNTSTASNSATVTTPAPPDTTAPAAPGNLTATAVSPSQVNLAWSASSDPSGISRYDVYRNGQLLTSTKTTSLADATASAGASYSYTVKAIDGAGNTSAASNTATVTMPAPQPATQTLSATPTDDSYVSRRKPNANYGNSSVIRADVSPELTGLYKFSVSGIGTKSVVSAKLRLYVSDGSDQGGQLYRLTSSNWSQATVTYTSRPTADTTSNLASLGKTVSGSWLEVDLTSLVTHDGSYGLQLTTPSSNTAGYASKETSSKPVLVVGVQ
jgi:fibronectin type 3 domain-containing protein